MTAEVQGPDEARGTSSGPSGPVLRGLVLAVVGVDTVLLALTEIAWASWRVGAVPLPASALVAAVTTPLLVRVADRACPGTRAPLAVLGLWVVVVVAVGFTGPAGVGMLPGDWRALLLVAAGLLPGTVTATRPVRPAPASPSRSS